MRELLSRAFLIGNLVMTPESFRDIVPVIKQKYLHDHRERNAGDGERVMLALLIRDLYQRDEEETCHLRDE